MREYDRIDYDSLGYRIRYQRKYVKKISQKKMAEYLGMYQPDLSNMENNNTGCGLHDLANLEEIARYLGISLIYLLFGDDEDDRELV